jgi:hypothetical protein
MQWVDQIHMCVVFHCAKLQELKCKDKCLQTSVRANVLNVSMHVHIRSSSSYKNFHKLSLLGIISRFNLYFGSK